ncbi:MAG: hypothetical protein RLZZ50_771 [Verrucomicrobiota bacterium]
MRWRWRRAWRSRPRGGGVRGGGVAGGIDRPGGVYPAVTVVDVIARGADVVGVFDQEIDNLGVARHGPGGGDEGGDTRGHRAGEGGAVDVSVAVAVLGGEDVDAGCREVDVGAEVGPGGAEVVGVGGRDGDHVGAGGGIEGDVVAVVAGCSDDHGGFVPGVIHRVLKRAGGAGSAQAEVDDARAGVGREGDAADDVGIGSGTVGAEDFDREDGGEPSDAGDP